MRRNEDHLIETTQKISVARQLRMDGGPSWEFVMITIKSSVLALGVASLVGAMPSGAAQAEIFAIGSNVAISGNDFTASGGNPTSINDTVTLNQQPSLIDNGLISVTEQITQLSQNSEAIEFIFSTVGGGSLIGDTTQN